MSTDRLRGLAILLLAVPATGLQLRPALAPTTGLRRSSRSGQAVAVEPAGAPSGGGLSLLGSKFEDALGSLKPADKYNAVLDSLLAKGRGTNAESGSNAVELVNEMTSRRLPLSPTSAKSLFDATARTDNLPVFLSALSAARANGVCRAFGSAKLAPRPSGASVSAALPADTRGPEVAAALAFTALLGSLLLLELVDAFDWLLPGETDAPPLVGLAVGLVAIWGVDRYTQRGEIAALLSRGLSRLFE